jgi:hypothetical protein
MIFSFNLKYLKGKDFDVILTVKMIQTIASGKVHSNFKCKFFTNTTELHSSENLFKTMTDLVVSEGKFFSSS